MGLIDHPATKTDYYAKVVETLNEVSRWGLLERSQGYCISISDIIVNRLRQKGIKAKLLECSLMITLKDPLSIFLVGYDGIIPEDFDPKEQTQNHVVCITDTEIPLLIDASISHVDPDISYVILPTDIKNSDHIIEYDYGTSIWSYKEKINTELPKLFQRSVIDRIKTDNKTRTDINLIKTGMILVSLVTTLNFGRGIFDFYQKYVNDTNNFGPERSLFEKK